MLNNFKLIILFLAFITFSCKKEPISFDRENDMVTDTVSLQIGFNILSSSTTQLDVEIEMLTFNNLVSETNYLDSSYKALPNQNQNTYVPSFTSYSFNSPISNSKYSTIFLFEVERKDFYQNTHFGMYLRRYLEQNSSTNNIALAYFKPNDLNSLHFSNNQKAFSVDWQTNITNFYDETNYYSNFPITPSFSALLTHTNSLIDSLIQNPNPLVNKSITLVFSDGYYYKQTDSLNFINLINKANLNQVEINIICNRADNIKGLALKTGGFIYTNNNYNYNGTPVEAQDYFQSSKLKYLLQNIHNLLSKNYTSHKATLSINSPTGGFYTNNFFYQEFGYNGLSYTFQIIIP